MADLCNRCGVHMDTGHVRGSRDCDKFLISKLDADMVKEKEIRVDYQEIVYKVCLLIDGAAGNSVRLGTGVDIGKVVDGVEQLAKAAHEHKKVRWALGEIARGVIAGQFSYCPDHGLLVRVDEDGCCISCGRDAMVYCRRAGP